MNEKNSIQELYDNPKSKGFVNHLIQSYLPLNKPSKIFDFEKGQKHKCSICGQKLFSTVEYLAGVQEKFNDISNGILRDDKNIIWLTKKMQRAEFFSHFENSPHLNDTEKNQTMEIKKRVEKKKVATFGDLEVLQDLKKKMEDNES